MRVAIIQSNYLPWRGYFDFIDSVDLFIVLDDVQFTPRDWRNRNWIKTAHGLQWITVPVHYRRHLAQRICETPIDYSRNWVHDHTQSIALNYARAPYLRHVLGLVEPVFDEKPATISDLNVALLRSVCAYLEIGTPMRRSTGFAADGTKSARLINLLRQVGATTYVSGPSARAYLDETLFGEAGIALEWKTYSYPDYPQLWGPFEGNVSIVDVIANCGPAAMRVIRPRAATALLVAA